MDTRYLILGGTEKAGTTSVYLYLRSHPHVAGSVRKETDYFRGPPPHSLDRYEAQFPGAVRGQMRMESSPGYLSESDIAAPAIAALIPHAKLLFILRDPIDRLLSSFVFHKARFFIPRTMAFNEYLDLCMSYERGEIDAEQAGLKDWHLRVPGAGRYAQRLRQYYGRFPRDHVKVTTLDELHRDPRAFMQAVCAWAGLDAQFYQSFEFIRANVSFSPRRAWLQRAGLWVNHGLEPFFNRHPIVKRPLLNLYKRINQSPEEKPRLSAATAERLVGYYQDDLAELLALVGDDVASARGWLRKYHAG